MRYKAPGLDIKILHFLHVQNANGLIDSKVLGNVLRSLGKNPDEKYVMMIKHLYITVTEVLFWKINILKAEVDFDFDGRLNMREFIILMSGLLIPEAEDKDDLVLAFSVFDTDGDGQINHREMMYLAKSVGIQNVCAKKPKTFSAFENILSSCLT